MKLTYHRCGDYLLPDLTIPDEPYNAWKVRQDAQDVS